MRIAVPATIIPILVAAFAAYAFSWMSFRGRDTLFLITVGLLVVPLQMAFIPLLRLINRGASIGSVKVIPATTSLLNNSAWAVIIAHTCFEMPLAVYLLRNFISQLPVATAFGPGKRVAPMTVKLVELAGSKCEEWQRLTAGAFGTMALPRAVFFALQRFFVRGLVTGSVKG